LTQAGWVVPRVRAEDRVRVADALVVRRATRSRPVRHFTEVGYDAAVARSYSATEIAAEADAPEDRITWLVSLGLLKPDERGSFSFGAVFAVKMVSALLEAGLSETTVERAANEGWLNFEHIDGYLPHQPERRSERTFAEFQAVAGPRASHLPAVYEQMGLPKPDPTAAIHVDEEEMLERFLEGWRLAGEDDALLRAARLMAEGTRAATLGWAELLDEQIAAPARERLLTGEVNEFPDEARIAFATLVGLVPEMFTWLSYRYLEQRSVETIVDGFEQFLASRDLAPVPRPHAPPTIVFVDLSGFTRLTEERGDETALRAAMSLQRRADATAARHDGRLVKLLGDGAMLRFPEAAGGVEAALELVETMSGEGALAAHAGIHAGPVIERDLDVFGRTVNLASRIADTAQPGEVLATDTVARATPHGSYRFEPTDDANLKGIMEPVPLFRVTRVP
jgi:adenylate cyclase